MLKKLRAQYEKILARMSELSNSTLNEAGEVRSFSEAEQSEYNSLKAKSLEVKTAIERALEEEQANSLVLTLGESRGGAPEIQIVRERNCNEDGDYRGFKNLGEQAIALRNLASRRGEDPRLKEMRQIRAAAGQNETVDSDGGFLVQSDFSGRLNEASIENSNLVSLCTNTPIGEGFNGYTENEIEEDSRADGYRNGGARAYWEGESDKYQNSKIKIRQSDLKLKKLAAMVPVTDENLEDATSLESELIRVYGEEMGFQKDRAIIEGSGVGEPLGFLTSGSLVKVPKKSGQDADTLVVENINAIWAAMTSKSKAKSIWLINSEVTPQLDLLKVGDHPVFIPPAGLSAAPYGTIKGRPVKEVEQCSKLGDFGDILCVDPTQYRWIFKGGTKVDVSIHFYFDTGQQAFRFTIRANGRPMLRTAITPYKGKSGAKLSSHVTVEDR